MDLRTSRLRDTMPDPRSSPEPVAPGAIGGAVARGSFWLVLNALFSRGASFVAQICLGALLAKEDFGVYALAISVTSLATAVKDGGVRNVLIQRYKEYDQLLGAVFWIAAILSTAVGVLIAASAPLVARAYARPDLMPLLLVIAASQPLGTPGAILTARLQIDMRFRDAGRIATISALFRYCATIGLAAAGCGPMSFVLPLPGIAVVEWIMAHRLVRERPWSHKANWKTWRSLLQQSKWVAVGSMSIALSNVGTNMAVGLFVPVTLLGVYFFGYQMVVQVGVLVGANLFQVLVPAFSKISDNPERRRAGSERSLRQITLLSSLLCMGVVVTFAPLELVFWNGKWSEATSSVRLLGVFYPLGMTATVPYAVLQACGRYRAYGLALLMVGIVSVAAAGLAAYLHGTAAAIAFSVGLSGAVAALSVVVFGLRAIGLGAKAIAAAVLPGWLLSVGVGAIVCVADRWLASGEILSAASFGVGAIVRTVFSGVLFVVIYVACTRLLLPAHLDEIVTILPPRIGGLLRAVLALRKDRSARPLQLT